jgi:hypothetical protein
MHSLQTQIGRRWAVVCSAKLQTDRSIETSETDALFSSSHFPLSTRSGGPCVVIFALVFFEVPTG